MIRSLILVAVTSLFGSSLFAQELSTSFLYEEENALQNEMVEGLPVIVLEDFEAYSVQPATILAIESNSVLVLRNNQMALLVPRENFEQVIHSNGIISFAESCQSQCAASSVGGALTGAVGGAAGGASAGGQIAGPQGALGGLVVGGIIGGIGGGITGFEVCKIATQCGAKPMTPGKGG